MILVAALEPDTEGSIKIVLIEGQLLQRDALLQHTARSNSNGAGEQCTKLSIDQLCKSGAPA
jgi:hypothetical protein